MSGEDAKETALGGMPPGGMPPGGMLPGGMTKEKILEAMKQTYKFKGTFFPKFIVPRENLEAMETFDVRDDDIFVLTYPKAGTHWTMEIIYLILADGYPDKIDREEKMKFGGLEMTLPGYPAVAAHKAVESIKSRRVLPTHLPENIMPPAVFNNKGKVIYVARNPKDTLTSFYTFQAKIAGMGNWNEAFDNFLSKDMMNGNIFDFNLTYWKHRHDENFLFLKYEDMKRDTRSAVISIADHIGCILSEEAIDRVVKHSSFEEMKKTYRKADDEGIITHFSGKGLENLSNFLRKGTVGDWKNYFTVAQNERFDAYSQEKLAGSGLVYEYE